MIPTVGIYRSSGLGRERWSRRQRSSVDLWVPWSQPRCNSALPTPPASRNVGDSSPEKQNCHSKRSIGTDIYGSPSNSLLPAWIPYGEVYLLREWQAHTFIQALRPSTQWLRVSLLTMKRQSKSLNFEESLKHERQKSNEGWGDWYNYKQFRE